MGGSGAEVGYLTTFFSSTEIHVIHFRVELQLSRVINVGLITGGVVLKSGLHFSILLLVKPGSVSVDLAEFMVVWVIETVFSKSVVVTACLSLSERLSIKA